MNAAALMTADQYRLEAQKMLEVAGDMPFPTSPISVHLVACAQVYALRAISAQAAENATDLPLLMPWGMTAEQFGRAHDPDAYDRAREYKRELLEEQALWDEAQDEASRDRAEGYEHTEDVP